MPVKMTCPNSNCGRRLSIKDKYAGRRGRCPFCGGKIEVPDVNGVLPKPAVKWAQNRAGHDQGDGFEVIEEDDEEKEEQDEEPRHNGSARRKRARSRAAEDDEDVEPVDDDDTKIPHHSGKKTAARSGSKSASKKIERPRETQPSEAPSSTSRPRPRRRVFDEPKPDRNAAIMHGVCALFLAVLALSALLPWFRVEGGGDPTSAIGTSLLAGDILLGASALACLVALGAAITYPFLGVKPANDMAAIAAAAAGGWATVATIWLVAWIWKGMGTAGTIQKIINRHSALPTLPPLAADNPLTGHGFAPDLKFSVGLGLWLGAAMGLIVVAVFTHLLGTRQRGGALLVCPGAGLLGGIAALIFNVRPWETFLAGR